MFQWITVGEGAIVVKKYKFTKYLWHVSLYKKTFFSKRKNHVNPTE